MYPLLAHIHGHTNLLENMHTQINKLWYDVKMILVKWTLAYKQKHDKNTSPTLWDRGNKGKNSHDTPYGIEKSINCTALFIFSLDIKMLFVFLLLLFIVWVFVAVVKEVLRFSTVKYPYCSQTRCITEQDNYILLIGNAIRAEQEGNIEQANKLFEEANRRTL